MLQASSCDRVIQDGALAELKMSCAHAKAKLRVRFFLMTSITEVCQLWFVSMVIGEDSQSLRRTADAFNCKLYAVHCIFKLWFGVFFTEIAEPFNKFFVGFLVR